MITLYCLALTSFSCMWHVRTASMHVCIRTGTCSYSGSVFGVCVEVCVQLCHVQLGSGWWFSWQTLALPGMFTVRTDTAWMGRQRRVLTSNWCVVSNSGLLATPYYLVHCERDSKVVIMDTAATIDISMHHAVICQTAMLQILCKGISILVQRSIRIHISTWPQVDKLLFVCW